ncbi:MAG TPA: 3'(2'),5'-bisphosphate nucleotidase CysQ [Oscillatoriaceae cyanobacterium M33_DOE_052]|uniref:inositol-phosphate phosphatase n=1 Tax=Planktothricoides sp. SpSt-374 TaxID=2282167 RepID=A0A7C3VH82_9CYAN|nr:3'(2'),5'-bisphosphate nucleotidase CysQ [Oscillatoriaceae cyanobacterium M33_DOE_052]
MEPLESNVVAAEQLEGIGAIVRRVGWGVADILRKYEGAAAAGTLGIREKPDGPVTTADLVASEYILRELRIAFGSENFGYLCEETPNQVPIPKPWVWIIDPIDGTRDFILGTGDYAVHIALVYKGRPVVAVVVLPRAGKLYYAQRGGGTYVETRNGEKIPLHLSGGDGILSERRFEDLCLVISRNRRHPQWQQLLELLPKRKREYIGSIGCRIAAILEGRADVYISLSGKSAPKDWDLAAPELILSEAGGKFTRVDGTPLRYNGVSLHQWGCLIGSNSRYHEGICDRVGVMLAQLDEPNQLSANA